MTSRNPHDHGVGAPHPQGEGSGGAHGQTVRDPVCGMAVDTRTACFRHEIADATYYFCSQGCLDKFRADPELYLSKAHLDAVEEVPAGTIYTCPMHPEIRQPGPGSCPICGMALEPEMFQAA